MVILRLKIEFLNCNCGYYWHDYGDHTKNSGKNEQLKSQKPNQIALLIDFYNIDHKLTFHLNISFCLLCGIGKIKKKEDFQKVLGKSFRYGREKFQILVEIFTPEILIVVKKSLKIEG